MLMHRKVIERDLCQVKLIYVDKQRRHHQNSANSTAKSCR
jgi:hypothetical protein